MKKTIAFLLVSITSVAFAFGQSANAMRINEILVKNVDNYMDDYGHRSSWIELHNTSHSTVDIGGCYLKTIAGGVETVYRIPSGDHRNTKIEPLGYCVFFCEGTGSKGTMYTNFTLDNIEYIALMNSSGRGAPIDEVYIDYDKQVRDVSIGYFMTDNEELVFGPLKRTTPNATNDVEPLLSRAEKFRMMDPTGWMMTVIAICVVLSVLAILFLLFKLLGNYMVGVTRRRSAKSKSDSSVASPKGKSYESPYSGEEVAAIAMALKMYADELHDKESAVLTINKVARAYSPWSSKIYGLTQFNKPTR